MSKHPIKWCKFELNMLHSQAFQDLNKPATTILMHVLMQLEWHNTSKKSQKKRWVCSNADQIKILYKHFEEQPFGFHISTISRAITSLLAHGFIMVNEQGGSCKGHATTYKYVEDWKRWRVGDSPIYDKTSFRGRGYTGKK